MYYENNHHINNLSRDISGSYLGSFGRLFQKQAEMKTKLLAWLISVQKYIYYILAFLFFMLIVFMKGCQYGKQHKKCPEIITNTVIIHDTVTHEIVSTYPHYINHTDTIIYIDTVLQDVDTAAILKDYFATHISDNRWQDSLVIVDLKTYISENKLKNSIFNYRILRPQTITVNTVDNSIHYNKYLLLGLNVPLKDKNYETIECTFVAPKWYAGAGYMPNIKSFTAKAGINILRFK